MTKRYKAPKTKDRATFRRTATKTSKQNVTRTLPRGGYRL